MLYLRGGPVLKPRLRLVDLKSLLTFASGSLLTLLDSSSSTVGRFLKKTENKTNKLTIRTNGLYKSNVCPDGNRQPLH